MCGLGGWRDLLLELLDFEDLVRHEPMRLAMYRQRRFPVGSVRQTEHATRRGVVPVPDISHAVLVLNGQVLRVCLGQRFERGAGGTRVNVEEARHLVPPKATSAGAMLLRP